MDAAHDLVQRFLAIPSTERDAALQALASILSNREAGVVQSAISARRDPFNKLPIELIVPIFEHLHPYDIWSKRLVSQRWNTVLSSEDLLRSSLARLADHDPTDSGLTLKPNAPLSTITNEVRHMQALRLGRPFSAKVIETNLVQMFDIKLKGSRIAYRDASPLDKGKTIFMHDVISGETISLHGEARERIMHMALTSEILAFTTFKGVLYVASLASLPAVRKATRLPSADVVSFAADLFVTAWLFKGDGDTTVVMHDAAAAKTTSFRFENHIIPQENRRPGPPDSLIVDAARKRIDVFFMVVNELENAANDHRGTFCARPGVQRFAFDGSVLKQHICPPEDGYVFRSLIKPSRVVNFRTVEYASSMSLHDALPAGRKRLYQLSLRCVPERSLLYDSEAMSFAFSPSPNICNKSALESRIGMSWERCRRPDFEQAFGAASTWKGHRYQASADLDQRTSDIYMMLPQPYNSAAAAAAAAAYEPLPHYGCGSSILWRVAPTSANEPLDDFAYYKPLNRVHMNDSFAVIGLGSGDRIQVLCFDERIRMHGSQPTKLWERRLDDEMPRRLLGERADEGATSGFEFVDFEQDCEMERVCDDLPAQRWRRTGWKMPYFDRNGLEESAVDSTEREEGR